ncbi:MAG: BamA/TamA family outer membrane protein [Bacteroidetes bacterium]|nr:BamA/TamA family outer membrane protein [Bacteroidota bacterium]
MKLPQRYAFFRKTGTVWCRFQADSVRKCPALLSFAGCEKVDEVAAGLPHLHIHCNRDCVTRAMRFFGLLFISLALHLSLSAQDKPVPREKTIHWLPVPTLGYAPETRAYIGAVVMATFHTHPKDTRASNAKTEFTYTQRHQVICNLGYTLFTPAEKYRLSGQLNLSRFPDNFWGFGNETPDSVKFIYNSTRREAEMVFQKNLGHNWFLGPLLRYSRFSRFDSLSGKSSVFFKQGALQTMGAGFSLLHDSRDNLLNPGKGYFVEWQSRYMKHRHTYLYSSLDLRAYRSFFDQRLVCAAKMVGIHSNPRGAPFYDAALLGGDRNQRGYYYGRYRDRGAVMAQFETRYTVYRRWGVAAFVTAGRTFGDLWVSKKVHTSQGIGVRFMADRKERTNMRIDYAFGKASGFYFSFGEAF